MLPTSYHIQDQFEVQDELPIAAGGSADVWKANGPSGFIAVKALRIWRGDDFDRMKKVRSLLHGSS